MPIHILVIVIKPVFVIQTLTARKIVVNRFIDVALR